MTKDEFVDWKSQEVTKQIFKLFQRKIEQGIDELSYQAGQDPGNDRAKVGKLDGLRTFTELTYDDLEDIE